MKPILYIDICSAPVRSCLMLIEYLKIDVDMKELNLFKGEQMSLEYKKINPIHTVPTLIDGDLTLTDSHAILIHLCERHRIDICDKLWPKDYNQRIRVLNMLLFDISTLFRRNSHIMMDIFYKRYANIDMKYHKLKILEIYDVLEGFLAQHEFMALPHMTIADWSILGSVSTSDLMLPIKNEQWPLLCKWFDYMKLLPEYHTNSKGLEKLRKSMESFGKCQLPLIS